jgi:uncharacterized protein YecE (DUF72 family)
MPSLRARGAQKATVATDCKIRIGISGWRYAPWRKTFYPEDLPQSQELAFASSKLWTIEINGTFYSLQRPESFAKWAEDTPDDFVFSVKAPRYITHIRRLKEIEKPLATFLASGVLQLGKKLGPILWQFPPNFSFEPERMETFFALLPHSTEEASRVAKGYDERILKKPATKVLSKQPMRHAIEIRNRTFVNPDFIAMLRKYDVALVCADSVEWPRMMDVTSDFMYCRLHGPEELYASGYDDASLDQWAGRVMAWFLGEEPADAERVVNEPGRKCKERDVFIYFDNDAKVRAPVDAQRLMQRIAANLKGKSSSPQDAHPEPRRAVRTNRKQAANAGRA